MTAEFYTLSKTLHVSIRLFVDIGGLIDVRALAMSFFFACAVEVAGEGS